MHGPRTGAQIYREAAKNEAREILAFEPRCAVLISACLKANHPDASVEFSQMSDAPKNLIVNAHALVKTYRIGAHDVTAINRIDLEIAEGALVVLKGNSGSGKSTLLSLLAGLDHPSQGTLQVAGQDLTRAAPAQLTHFRRHVVGIVFQSFNLLPTLTVEENVCLPALLAGRPFRSIHRKAAQLLEWLNMSGRVKHLPAQLSGGEMQRTAIARALINDPPIILADEPTGNLDSRNGEAVMELLRDLNQQFRRTVIVATHSDLADAHATRQILLKDGTVVDQR